MLAGATSFLCQARFLWKENSFKVLSPNCQKSGLTVNSFLFLFSFKCITQSSVFKTSLKPECLHVHLSERDLYFYDALFSFVLARND